MKWGNNHMVSMSSLLFVGFVLMIFNEGAYLTFKSIFHKALKDGIFAICYLRSQCFPLNVEYYTRKPLEPFFNIFGLTRSFIRNWTLALETSTLPLGYQGCCKSSKWNLLHMIPMKSWCAWHRFVSPIPGVPDTSPR